jgi:hypothetical protein
MVGKMEDLPQIALRTVTGNCAIASASRTVHIPCEFCGPVFHAGRRAHSLHAKAVVRPMPIIPPN